MYVCMYVEASTDSQQPDAPSPRSPHPAPRSASLPCNVCVYIYIYIYIIYVHTYVCMSYMYIHICIIVCIHTLLLPRMLFVLGVVMIITTIDYDWYAYGDYCYWSDCYVCQSRTSGQGWKGAWPGGNNLSNTTCLTQAFFKGGEECGTSWGSLTLYTTQNTHEAVLDKSCQTSREPPTHQRARLERGYGFLVASWWLTSAEPVAERSPIGDQKQFGVAHTPFYPRPFVLTWAHVTIHERLAVETSATLAATRCWCRGVSFQN